MIPRSLFRYSLVGIVTNAAAYCVFLALLWWTLPAVWSAAIGYFAGMAFSYLANRLWSFESVAGHRSDIFRFLLAYGLCLTASVVFILVLTAFLRPEIAQVINIGLTAIIVYLCLRIFRFGQN